MVVVRSKSFDEWGVHAGHEFFRLVVEMLS